MSHLETIVRENWEDFLAAPAAVLMLGKSDCPACAAWTEELTAFLESDSEWTSVRFGKLLLEQVASSFISSCAIHTNTLTATFTW